MLHSDIQADTSKDSMNLDDYLGQQLRDRPHLIEAAVKGSDGQLLPERKIVVQAKTYDEFLANPKSSSRWVVIPGLMMCWKYLFT